MPAQSLLSWCFWTMLFDELLVTTIQSSNTNNASSACQLWDTKIKQGLWPAKMCGMIANCWDLWYVVINYSEATPRWKGVGLRIMKQRSDWISNYSQRDEELQHPTWRDSGKSAEIENLNFARWIMIDEYCLAKPQLRRNYLFTLTLFLQLQRTQFAGSLVRRIVLRSTLRIHQIGCGGSNQCICCKSAVSGSSSSTLLSRHRVSRLRTRPHQRVFAYGGLTGWLFRIEKASYR